MVKKKLLALRKLNATDAMMARAGADTLRTVKRNEYWHPTIYQWSAQMRVQVLGGILKAAVFLEDDMKDGKREPRYEIYINPAGKEFITYDTVKTKWLTAMANNLDFSNKNEKPSYSTLQGLPFATYCNQDARQNIKTYLKTEKNSLEGISEWQHKVRAERIEEKEKKMQAPWDEKMSLIPEIPKEFSQWARIRATDEHYIFYRYSKGGAKVGWCTSCEKYVPIEKPKYNERTMCKCCGREVTLKSVGRNREIWSRNFGAGLVSPIRGGYVIRTFSCRNVYKPGKKVEFVCTEETRYIRWNDGRRDLYYWYFWRNKFYRWVPAAETIIRYPYGYYVSQYSPNYMLDESVMVYPDAEGLTGPVTRTGLPEIITAGVRVAPTRFIEVHEKLPLLEQISKAGLTQLAVDISDKNGALCDENDTKLPTDHIGQLDKVLSLDKFRIGRMRKANGGNIFYDWLRYEKKRNTVFPDDVIAYLSGNKIRPEDTNFIQDKMSPQKIANYLRKQSAMDKKSPRETLQTWRDYLDMAHLLKYNIDHEMFYKPKDLRKAHDDCVKAGGSRDLFDRVCEIKKKFPDIEKVLADIKPKYEYRGEKFSIVVPERIADIIFEGRALGHCLDRSDIYFDRISHRESYIVFLRRTEKIDKPFYTLEIEPDGTARQKRTTGDKQDKDFEACKSFIRKWQNSIQKNLAPEDRSLALKSADLRVREFTDLRKKQSRIWHGALQGQLLVDVLEADLMVVGEEADDAQKQDRVV